MILLGAFTASFLGGGLGYIIGVGVYDWLKLKRRQHRRTKRLRQELHQ